MNLATDILRLAYCAAKETTLLLRDRQTLALFFIMPVVFVGILSLALRDIFGGGMATALPVLIQDVDDAGVGESLARTFAHGKRFLVERRTGDTSDAAIQQAIRRGGFRVAILVPPGTTEAARARIGEIVARVPPELRNALPAKLRLFTDPALRGDSRIMVVQGLAAMLHGVEMGLAADAIKPLAPQLPPLPWDSDLGAPAELVAFAVPADEVVGSHGLTALPSSIQQNAPAWTLLAMFFLVVPLSVSFIKERTQGSLYRVQAIGVPAWAVLGGKAIPFLVINQIQFVLVSLASVYLVPLLGGDRLTLGNSMAALALLSVSASLAALGFASLTAVYARTVEQATTLSSTMILVFAALGGILVPKVLMPPIMQTLSQISPFAWGLDGFLEIFVRGGDVKDAMPHAAKLLAFSAVTHALAIYRYHKPA